MAVSTCQLSMSRMIVATASRGLLNLPRKKRKLYLCLLGTKILMSDKLVQDCDN